VEEGEAGGAGPPPPQSNFSSAMLIQMGSEEEAFAPSTADADLFGSSADFGSDAFAPLGNDAATNGGSDAAAGGPDKRSAEGVPAEAPAAEWPAGGGIPATWERGGWESTSDSLMRRGSSFEDGVSWNEVGEEHVGGLVSHPSEGEEAAFTDAHTTTDGFADAPLTDAFGGASAMHAFGEAPAANGASLSGFDAPLPDRRDDSLAAPPAADEPAAAPAVASVGEASFGGGGGGGDGDAAFDAVFSPEAAPAEAAARPPSPPPLPAAEAHFAASFDADFGGGDSGLDAAFGASAAADAEFEHAGVDAAVRAEENVGYDLPPPVATGRVAPSTGEATRSSGISEIDLNSPGKGGGAVTTTTQLTLASDVVFCGWSLKRGLLFSASKFFVLTRKAQLRWYDPAPGEGAVKYRGSMDLRQGAAIQRVGKNSDYSFRLAAGGSSIHLNPQSGEAYKLWQEGLVEALLAGAA